MTFRPNPNGVMIGKLLILHVARGLGRNLATVFGDRAGIMCPVRCSYSSTDLVKMWCSGQMPTLSRSSSFTHDHEIWPEQYKNPRRLSLPKDPHLPSTFQHRPWEITVLRPNSNNVKSSSLPALPVLMAFCRNNALVFGDCSGMD